jgi:hypothetical protein
MFLWCEPPPGLCHGFPLLLLIQFTSSRSLRHRLSRRHWIGFITTNPGLSCLITHTWFRFPLISMLYMCPLFPIVLVDYCPISVRLCSAVSAFMPRVFVQLLLRVSSRVLFRGLHLILLFGLNPCVIYTRVCFGLRPRRCHDVLYFGWRNKKNVCIPAPVSYHYTAWQLFRFATRQIKVSDVLVV